MSLAVKALPMMPRLASAWKGPEKEISPISKELLCLKRSEANQAKNDELKGSLDGYDHSHNRHQKQNDDDDDDMESIESLPHHYQSSFSAMDDFQFEGNSNSQTQDCSNSRQGTKHVAFSVEPSLRQDFGALFQSSMVSISSSPESEPFRDTHLEEAQLPPSPQQQVVPIFARTEHYTSALHLALCQNASPSTLQMIVGAGKYVLLQKEGPGGLTPLALSLKASPQNTDVHNYLLQTEPSSAEVACDENHDLPLHLACQAQADSQIIVSLIQAHPSAVFHRNRNGHTPLDSVLRQAASAQRNLLVQLLQQATMIVMEQSFVRNA